MDCLWTFEISASWHIEFSPINPTTKGSLHPFREALLYHLRLQFHAKALPTCCWRWVPWKKARSSDWHTKLRVFFKIDIQTWIILVIILGRFTQTWDELNIRFFLQGEDSPSGWEWMAGWMDGWLDGWMDRSITNKTLTLIHRFFKFTSATSLQHSESPWGGSDLSLGQVILGSRRRIFNNDSSRSDWWLWNSPISRLFFSRFSNHGKNTTHKTNDMYVYIHIYAFLPFTFLVFVCFV